MQQFDVSFAIRRGAPAPVPSGGCEESLFERRSIAVSVGGQILDQDASR